MKQSFTMFNCQQSRSFLFFFVFFLLLSCISLAQFRKMGFAYSENIKGGAVLFGNTLMYSAKIDGTPDTVAMNGNRAAGYSNYDNGNGGLTNMQFVDIDGNTAEGAGTKNSSSADLILPAGVNSIKLARLYWGGRAWNSEYDMTDQVNQTIKIRKDTTGAYTEFPAAQIDRSVFDVGLPTESSRYQAFADITTLVQQNGAGTYTVGNGAFTTGTGGDFGNYGGWCIVVVYENPTLNFNSVRVIDGFQEVYSGGSAFTNPIQITGLNVPSGTLLPEDAQIGVMAWEGDARYTGDFFKINNILFFNAINPQENPFNGTVSINGQHVTTKKPNYTDQMGVDIDDIYAGAGYGISANASSISLQYGTTQDQYFSGVITAVIKMKESDVKIIKTVTDANSNQIAGAGEILTYKIKGKNTVVGNATAVSVQDSLPSTIVFVPGSLRVNYCPGVTTGLQTDAAGDDIAEFDAITKTINFRLGTGANSITGGSLAASDSFEVEFKVTFNPVANGIAPPIVNVARLTAISDALENFVDDASVTINGATAQRITYTFIGNGNWDVPANWSGNKIPPATLPVFSTIIIDHIVGGQCLLNVTQNIATGASFIVNTGKNIVVPGLLKIF
jgi:uncharacterized repeat protein (TIGR01451 family)